MPRLRRRTPSVFIFALALAAAAAAQERAGKQWIDRAPALEAYLRSAEIDRMEDTSVGVTRPRHAFLKPGGPFTELLWKPLAPGHYKGYFESYRSEIAAYEIDKLVALHMVPP